MKKFLMSVILSILVITAVIGGVYYLKWFDENEPVIPVGMEYVTNNEKAKYHSSVRPQGVLSYITDCKRFPDSSKDLFKLFSEQKTDECHHSYYVEDKRFQPPWLDPWGRPYQIRYDLERAKLQVRSQGRFSWIESDDIVKETYFNGKSYKAQVEYCKTVSKDDMSCIFNRGWH